MSADSPYAIILPEYAVDVRLADKIQRQEAFDYTEYDIAGVPSGADIQPNVRALYVNVIYYYFSKDTCEERRRYMYRVLQDTNVVYANIYLQSCDYSQISNYHFRQFVLQNGIYVVEEVRGLFSLKGLTVRPSECVVTLEQQMYMEHLQQSGLDCQMYVETNRIRRIQKKETAKALQGNKFRFRQKQLAKKYNVNLRKLHTGEDYEIRVVQAIAEKKLRGRANEPLNQQIEDGLAELQRLKKARQGSDIPGNDVISQILRYQNTVSVAYQQQEFLASFQDRILRAPIYKYVKRQRAAEEAEEDEAAADQ